MNTSSIKRSTLSPLFTACIEVVGVLEEDNSTILVVELTSGKLYSILTSNTITPFGVTFKEKDYFVDVSELVKYQDIWLNDMCIKLID